jgi:hypothetical protein
MITANLSNSNSNRACLMSFAVSGATTVAAADARSLIHTSSNANAQGQITATYLVTGLAAGSHTFTAKYRAGSNTCTFAERNIVVTPY